MFLEHNGVMYVQRALPITPDMKWPLNADIGTLYDTNGWNT